MDIEVFPANQVCEQGCAKCPLARRSGSKLPEMIDAEVQHTFTVLESVFSQCAKRYRIHLMSEFSLFPEFKNPGLIQAARFETAKTIREGDNARRFSDNVRAFMNDRSISPASVQFSIVPTSPLLETADSLVIEEVLDALSSWYYTKPYQHIDVTVRSNLVTPAMFQATLPRLFAADKQQLGRILRNKTSQHRAQRRVFTLGTAKAYASLYTGTAHTRKLTVGNRLITKLHEAKTMNDVVEEASPFYPKSETLVNFAIAPKGVMLIHSSITINNPLLWVSHADFRATLLRASAKDNFSILAFMQKLMKENYGIYHAVNEIGNPPAPLSELWMSLFEYWRPRIKKK